MDWLTANVGETPLLIFFWIIGLLVAFVLLLTAIRLVRSLMPGTFIAGGSKRRHRLSVIDAAAVDSRRRLVLITRDGHEHLLLVGGPNDLVIENCRNAEAIEEDEAKPQAEIAEAPKPEPVALPPARQAVEMPDEVDRRAAEIVAAVSATSQPRPPAQSVSPSPRPIANPPQPAPVAATQRPQAPDVAMNAQRREAPMAPPAPPLRGPAAVKPAPQPAEPPARAPSVMNAFAEHASARPAQPSPAPQATPPASPGPAAVAATAFVAAAPAVSAPIVEKAPPVPQTVPEPAAPKFAPVAREDDFQAAMKKELDQTLAGIGPAREQEDEAERSLEEEMSALLDKLTVDERS